jgi:hypothetical protein
MFTSKRLFSGADYSGHGFTAFPSPGISVSSLLSDPSIHPTYLLNQNHTFLPLMADVSASLASDVMLPLPF